MRNAGLNEEEIKRVIDPMESFHLQLAEEAESYERLWRGEIRRHRVERAIRILDALNVNLRTKAVEP